MVIFPLTIFITCRASRIRLNIFNKIVNIQILLLLTRVLFLFAFLGTLFSITTARPFCLNMIFFFSSQLSNLGCTPGAELTVMLVIEGRCLSESF